MYRGLWFCQALMALLSTLPAMALPHPTPTTADLLRLFSEDPQGTVNANFLAAVQRAAAGRLDPKHLQWLSTLHCDPVASTPVSQHAFPPPRQSPSSAGLDQRPTSLSATRGGAAVPLEPNFHRGDVNARYPAATATLQTATALGVPVPWIVDSGVAVCGCVSQLYGPCVSQWACFWV